MQTAILAAILAALLAILALVFQIRQDVRDQTLQDSHLNWKLRSFADRTAKKILEAMKGTP